MKKLDRHGYLFIAPFWIVFLIFSIYPVALTFYYSFTNYTGAEGEQLVGLANYTRLLGDTYFIEAFFNTIKIWGLNFILQIGGALMLALLFSDLQLKLKGLAFFRATFYLPNLITISSVALLFGILLDWQHGSLNMMLTQNRHHLGADQLVDTTGHSTDFRLPHPDLDVARSLVHRRHGRRIRHLEGLFRSGTD